MYHKSEQFSTYTCSDCGLYQIDSEMDSDTIASYYPSDSYYSYNVRDAALKTKVALYRMLFKGVESDTKSIRKFIGWPLRQLMRGLRVRPGDNVLDVGCGGGKFLALIKGLSMKPYGVEINPDSIKACSDVTDQIYIGPFEDIEDSSAFSNKADNTFETIVSNHVIEHSADPKRFLEAVKRHLADDGEAIIATPNPISLCAKLFGNYWAQLDLPRHLYLISPKVMERYAEAAGLQIVDQRHMGDQHGFVGSTLYLFESKFNAVIPAQRKRKFEAVGKVLLFPFYSFANLLKVGDTVEYTFRKAS
jgi:2-polyprenyl-3-methyl-5-hydroxy-6-metoxy-1,4-benzoquinol methylase